jgi:hypothetical protein
MRRSKLSAALNLVVLLSRCHRHITINFVNRSTRRFSATLTMASEAKKPLSHRSVVSSFIFKFDEGKPLVALFRRSDRVNTYQ